MSDNRKFVIFDLDGTLIDSYECVLRCVNKTLTFFSLSIVENIPQSERSGDIDAIFDKAREIVKKHIPYECFKSVFDYVHYNGGFETISINKGTKDELMKYIALGYKILIITNKLQETANKIVGEFFPDYAIDIIGRIGIASLKSNPKKVKNLLNNHNYKLEDCLCYYGDSIEDENLSHELGISFVKTL